MISGYLILRLMRNLPLEGQKKRETIATCSQLSSSTYLTLPSTPLPTHPHTNARAQKMHTHLCVCVTRVCMCACVSCAYVYARMPSPAQHDVRDLTCTYPTIRAHGTTCLHVNAFL